MISDDGDDGGGGGSGGGGGIDDGGDDHDGDDANDEDFDLSPGNRTMEARVCPTCKLGIPSVPILSRTCRRVAKESRLQPAVGCSKGQARAGGG